MIHKNFRTDLMKKILILVSIFALVLPSALCLSQDEEEINESRFELGLFFGFKGGVNGNYIPEGRKNAFGFNAVPDFGARAMFPLEESAKLSMSFDLSYSTYMYGVKNYYNNDFYTHKYGYIAFSPMFHFLRHLLVLILEYLSMPISAKRLKPIISTHLPNFAWVRNLLC